MASFAFQTTEFFNKNLSPTQLQLPLDKPHQHLAMLMHQWPCRTSPLMHQWHVTQIRHFLQGTVAALMATMCFVLAADTLGAQLTAMCTPLLSPCNFPRITGEAFSTQGSNAHAGASVECCGQVQEKFKGGRASFSIISLAVITKVPSPSLWLGSISRSRDAFWNFFREHSVPDGDSRIASAATSKRPYQSQQPLDPTCHLRSLPANHHNLFKVSIHIRG